MYSVSNHQLLCKVMSNANEECYKLADHDGVSNASKREQTMKIDSKYTFFRQVYIPNLFFKDISSDGCFHLLGGKVHCTKCHRTITEIEVKSVLDDTSETRKKHHWNDDCCKFLQCVEKSNCEQNK